MMRSAPASWWKIHARTLASTAMITGLVVLVLGNLTALRPLMYGVLLTVGAIAFLPFVVIAFILGLVFVAMLAVSVIAGLADTDLTVDIGDLPLAEGFSDHALEFVPAYYRLLARIRHPVALGIPLGLLLGGLSLWGMLALTLIPREIATRERLMAVKAVIDEAYGREHRLPDANAEGTLPPRLTELETNDGFGQPLRYTVHGHWKIKTYELRSLGEDGIVSDDDMCIGGSTRLARLAHAGLDLIFARIGAGNASYEDELAAVGALRCSGSPESNPRL